MPADVTVARLLRRAFAVLLLLIVVSGGAGIATANVGHRTVKDLTDRVLPLQLANDDLRSVVADAQRGLRGYLLTGDNALLGTYDAARRGYRTAADTARRLADRDQRDAINRQLARADAWWALADRQRTAVPRSEEAAAFVTEGRHLFLAFEDANRELDAALGARADQLRARSAALGMVTTVGLVALTLAATILAALTAVRATRRITAPLQGVVTVLDRLGTGHDDARAAAKQGPAEIRAVAGAVNAMANQAVAARAREEEVARLWREVRALNTRVRQHLSVDTAMQEAATGLVAVLGAQHALIRLCARDGEDRLVAVCSVPDAAGDLDPLAGLDAGWLRTGDAWVAGEPDDPAARGVPAPELAAWRAAGGGPLVTVTLSNGEEPLGAVTLVRAPGEDPWTPVAVRLVESVAADLGRGVHQARLYEQEQLLVAQLKELDTVKTDFMSTVSHELRTPLTSIAGYVEMLRDEDAGSVTPAQAKMLDVIARNTVRLRALIEDLLTLSRIEAGTFRTHRSTVDLADVLADPIAEARAAGQKAGVAVVADLHRPLPVRADADQLERVAANLFANAVKFTPAGGRVSVAGAVAGDEVVLTVADTGMGVPAAEQQHLFTRFFRASNAVHHAIPGTGLGLAIIRTILANHDGVIDVESAEGAGTTVTVRLPHAPD